MADEKTIDAAEIARGKPYPVPPEVNNAPPPPLTPPTESGIPAPPPEERGPVLKPELDIPVQIAIRPDRKQIVDAIISSLDGGLFQSAAQMWDGMRRDDRIASDLATRRVALFGSAIEWKAADERPEAEEVKERLGGVDDKPGLWEEIAPAAVCEDIFTWGRGLGIGIGEITFTARDMEWIPHLRSWHPQFVYWRWDTRSYWLVTQTGLVELPRVHQALYSDGHWVLYMPYGFERAWMQGWVRPLAYPYLIRGWSYVDWAHANEKYGSATDALEVPSKASEKEKKRVFSAVANRGANTAIMLPQDDEGKGYKLTLIESRQRISQSFDDIINRTEKSISLVILGQDSSGMTGGSLQDAKTRVSNAHLRMDAVTWQQTMRQQVIHWYCVYNYGDGTLAPSFEYDVRLPEDKKDSGAADLSTAQTVTELWKAGAPIDMRAYLDRRGFPVLPEGAPPQLAPPPPPGAAPGAPPAPTEEGQLMALAASLGIQLGADREPVARYFYQGLPIAVENPAGTWRTWHDADNNETGRIFMLVDYGRIEGYPGPDGGDLDCYVNLQHPEAPDAYVIHQHKAPDYERWDEDKLMLGQVSEAAARSCYAAHRNDGERAIGGVSILPVARLRRKLDRRRGTGKVRASADSGTLVTLASNARGGYTDRLAQAGTTAGAQAMASHLKQVLSAIRGAKDAKDAKARLLALYKGLDPAQLQERIRRAVVLAKLAGRHDVVAGLL